jgi:hypothetical protein
MADDRATQRWYLAEVFASYQSAEQQQREADRIRKAVEALPRAGTPVRYLESLLVPSEEIALYLFEAEGPSLVEHALRDAGLQAERISPAVIDRRFPTRAL